MTRIFAIATQKGGVGKTTLATNLSGVLARTHAVGRTLLIDLDPQANATSIFLGESAAYRPEPGLHLYHALCKGIPASQIIRKAALTHRGARRPRARWMCCPRTSSPRRPSSSFSRPINRERQLQNCLDDVAGKYDVIILDCPPSLGLITINALTAATDVMIPVEPGHFSIIGLAQLLKTIDMLRSGARPINKDLNMFGVVLMKADNTALTTLTMQQLESNFPGQGAAASLRRAARCATRSKRSQTLSAISGSGAKPRQSAARLYRAGGQDDVQRFGHGGHNHAKRTHTMSKAAKLGDSNGAGIFALIGANTASTAPVQAPSGATEAAGEAIAMIHLSQLRMDVSQPRRPLPLALAQRVNSGEIPLPVAVPQ